VSSLPREPIEGEGQFEPLGIGLAAAAGHTPAMGVQTRGLDITINARRRVADAAARAEAKAVIQRWNEQLVASSPQRPRNGPR
jgi:hypothetical protein